MASRSIYNNPDLETLRKFQSLEKQRIKSSGKDYGSNKDILNASTISKLRNAIRKDTEAPESKKPVKKIVFKKRSLGEDIVQNLEKGSTYIPSVYHTRKRRPSGKRQTAWDYMTDSLPQKVKEKNKDDLLTEKPKKQTRTYLNVLEGYQAKAFSSMRKEIPNYKVIGAELHKFVRVQGKDGVNRVATLIMNMPK